MCADLALLWVCRVYLLGGASAQPGDEVVVYTPASLSEHGIALTNMTLPPGTFWSDAVSAPAGQTCEPRHYENQGSSPAHLHVCSGTRAVGGRLILSASLMQPSQLRVYCCTSAS